MENPKHIIELGTSLDANKIPLVEKFLNNVIDIDNVEIYNPEHYIHSEFSNKLYLWAYNHDFTVILQKLGNTSSYLVTSFYIDNQKKKDVFQKKFENYQNRKDMRVNNCEWF
jgi:hypothetical protein